ncbi:MAG: type II toxin-antitoxin system VapC family toxin [Rhodothermales bacterium]
MDGHLVKLLFDTHTFIWWDSSAANLSAAARSALLDPANALTLSVVSVWEIQIKRQLGKMNVSRPLDELVRHHRLVNHVELIPVTLEHVLGLDVLSDHHRDPFDRLLIAQANAEGAVLVTKDAAIRKYSVQTLW